jgi:hypothetical protein
MEVGQGPNWGCSAKGKNYILKQTVNLFLNFYLDIRRCLSTSLDGTGYNPSS